MTLLTCAAVRRRLAAFHDGELPVGDTIAVEAHLETCPPCAREARALTRLGEVLRQAARGPGEDLAGLQPGILSRIKVERQESLGARTGRLFEDMHLVWIGLAATAGTLVCGAIVFGLLSFAPPVRSDSLSAVLDARSAVRGSNLNPLRIDARIRIPTLPEDPYGIMPNTLERVQTEEDLMLALSAIVTREGRVTGLEVLTSDRERRDVLALLDALSRAQLQPALSGGSPVAVNAVFLLTNLTVRGKSQS
jgi:hypothetical protein